MSIKTRTRLTLNDKTIKEKYVECIKCGNWRWVQFQAPSTQCRDCNQSLIIRAKIETVSKGLTNSEKALIKAFILTYGVSTKCATESTKYKGKPVDYGVSNCSPKHN